MRFGWLCRGIFWLFVALYAMALATYVVGIFGLSGQERDPLAGAFLAPLGSPWSRAIDWFPEPLRPWLAALAPLLNLLVLRLLCGARRRSGGA